MWIALCAFITLVVLAFGLAYLWALGWRKALMEEEEVTEHERVTIMREAAKALRDHDNLESTPWRFEELQEKT